MPPLVDASAANITSSSNGNGTAAVTNNNNNDRHDPESLIFSPAGQPISGVLSLLLSICLLGLGNALFWFPTQTINIIFSTLIEACGNGQSALNDDSAASNALAVTLARWLGGATLTQAMSAAVMAAPVLYDSWFYSNAAITQASVDKMRTSLSQHFIAGLSIVMVALLLDRDPPCSSDDSDKSFLLFQGGWTLLAMGCTLLILSCIGLMITYWPAEAPASQSIVTQHQSGHAANADEEDLTPLLGEQNDASNSEQNAPVTNYQLMDAQNDDGGENSVAGAQSELPDEPTSRIRGTKRLLKLAAPQMMYLYIGCVVLLIRLPFSLSIPHFVSTTLGAVGRGDFDQARTEILLLVLLGSIDAVLDFWCIFLFGYANQRIVRGVRIDTFIAILRQDIAFFDKHSSGELASRLNSDCGEMAGDLTWFFRFSIESVVRITGITAYMLIRCPALGGCALSIIPVVAIVNKYYGNWLGKNAQKVQDALAEANSVAQETFSCVRTVVAFATEDWETQRYRDKIDVQYHLNIRQLYMTGFYYMAISTFLVNTIVQATLLLVGSMLIEEGKLTGEVLLAFLLYQGQLQNEMLNLFQSYSSLIKSSGAGDKVFALLDRRPPPPGTGNERVLSAAVQSSESCVDRAPMAIKLESVHFTYPTRPEQPVLQGINLDIKPGSTVAIVGASGCGKSTIVGLLQRQYDPSSGRLFIDDQHIQGIDIKLHRRRIGVVTQDPALFTGTILSNIMYGMENVSRVDAIEAAKMANADSFIHAFPDGYDTEVGERGQQLSGGQKQRIAIARAIVRKPALLLLDEATSALDTESEQIVQEALDGLLKENNCSHQTTTVVIAHRLRTVRNADLIAVVKDGQIVEVGNHEELLMKDGKQAKGYYKVMVEKSRGDKLAE